MAGLSLVANLATIVSSLVGLLTLLVAGYEAVTGYFRGKLENLDSIPEIEAQLQQMRREQQRRDYALLDIAEAANNQDKRVDTDELVDDLLENDPRRGQYVDGGGTESTDD